MAEYGASNFTDTSRILADLFLRVFNDNIPPEPAYPSAIPSTSDFTALYDQDEWQKKEPLNSMVPPESWHSPPG